MAGEVYLLPPFVLRLQGGGIVDPAQKFQVMAKLMAQDPPQASPGLRRIRPGVSPVKGALVQDDLPHAGQDLILAHRV